MKPLKVPTDFNAEKEVLRLKNQTKTIRKRRYAQRKSRLDPYHGEIIELKKSGAKPSEIHRWLLGLRVRIAFSTLSRWLKRNYSDG